MEKLDRLHVFAVCFGSSFFQERFLTVYLFLVFVQWCHGRFLKTIFFKISAGFISFSIVILKNLQSYYYYFFSLFNLV